MTRRSRLTPVLALLALGAFLRLYAFWKPDLWLDEYGTWWVAGAGFRDAILRAQATGTTSPLFYLLVKPCLDALGPGTFSLRLPSVVFGLGILALAYPLGLRILGEARLALLGLAAFAVDPKLIWYSQEARPYSMALCLAMLSFFFYAALLERERLADRVGYVLATAAAYYAHYLFALIVLVQALHLWLGSRSRRVPWRAWAWSVCALVALGSLSLTHLARLYLRRQALDWISRLPVVTRGWDAPFQVALEFIDERMLFIVVAITLASRLTGRVESGRRLPPGLAVLWFVLPILLLAVVPPLFGVLLLSHRYALVAAPAALYLVGWLMGVGRRDGPLSWAPLAALLALTLCQSLAPAFASYGTFSYWPPHGQGWAEAGRLLEKLARDGDVILMRSGFVGGDQLASGKPDALLASGSLWPLQANLPSRRLRILFLPFSADHESLEASSPLLRAAAAQPRLWLVGEGRVLRVARSLLVSDAAFVVKRRFVCSSLVLIELERAGP